MDLDKATTRAVDEDTNATTGDGENKASARDVAGVGRVVDGER